MEKTQVKIVVSLFGLCMSAGAQSQTTQEADSNSAKTSEIQEIVVTAQRRSQRLQDVPLTVSALSAESLEAANITNVQDLSLSVPGLSVNNGLGFAVTHIRGIGSTQIGPGFESPIATYVDGVYYASTTSSLFDFLNVKDIQVLKGPQGTLFGRNATGGLIQVTTAEPTQTTVLRADLGYGNFNAVKGDFYVGGGITPTLTADFAFQVGHSGEGYGTNLATGEDVGQNDLSLSARSKWVWRPSDVTKVTGSIDFAEQRNSFGAQRVAPGSPNEPPLDVLQPAPRGGFWDVTDNEQPLTKNKNGGASLRLDQEFSPFNLLNIAAYRRAATNNNFDLDYTAEPFLGAYLHSDETQMSDELQLSSKPGDRIQWASGVYYFHSNSKYDPSQVTFDPNPALNPGFSALNTFSNQQAMSIAGYGQATGAIFTDTNLTLGARYTYERHSINGYTAIYAPDGSFLLNSAEASDREVTFEKPTYRVSLDHRFSPTLLAYVSFSTGYKSGGFNTQVPTDPVYEPESLKAYEIGLKTDFWDRRIRLDVAGFHDKYKDIQIDGFSDTSTHIINGAAATINGADVDAELHVSSQLFFTASAEYLDATFDSFPDAPLGAPNIGTVSTELPGSAAGNDLPFASRLVYTIAGNYGLAIGQHEINSNLTWNHTSQFAFEADNVLRQPTFNKINASIHWSRADSHFGVELWGKNLTNAATLTFGGSLNTGLREVIYAAPRTYGITFQYHLD
jgi:iron complex outermembrane receptor protein